MSSTGVEKLQPSHDLKTFDCGQPDLNRWLCRFALTNNHAGSASTYVALEEGVVIGFYSLAVGQIDHATSAPRLKHGLARHPIPVMILARLAVSLTHRGKGLGRALLRDAVLRTLQAADIAGIRAILVHAKDDHAKRFYEAFDFQQADTDPLHLFALLKDLRALVGQATTAPAASLALSRSHQGAVAEAAIEPPLQANNSSHLRS